MKKILVLAIALLTSQQIFAQVELSGFGGWLWTGSIPAWRQNIKVSDEGNYGATIGFRIREEMLAEFQILLQRHRIGKLRGQSTNNAKTQKARANFCSTTHAAPAQAKRDLKVPGMLKGQN